MANAILHFFSINHIFLTIYGYKMSYLEFLGIIFNFYSVYLVAKDNLLTWPIGNIGAGLFALLFYQIHLYSEMIEQIYFLIVGFYGWWMWVCLKKASKSFNEEKATIGQLSHSKNAACLCIILIGTVSMGYVMSHINMWFPRLFASPASFPYIDAFVALMSFAALLLMTHKKIESWYLWIAIDLIVIGLYCIKGVMLMALLYAFLLVIAIKGTLYWRKLITKRKVELITQ